jgi:hypothetical protein
MSEMTVEGKVERVGMGAGTWALVTPEDQTYEIYQGAPADLLKSGLKVKVQGQIREDVMTFAMVGPVLEVHSYEVLDS